MRRCRTRSDDRNIGAGNVLQDADISRRHVDDAARDEERRDFSRAAGQEFVVVVFDGLDATDSGAQCHTDSMPVFLGNFEARVPDRVDGRADAVMNERVILPLVFLFKVGIDIEALHEPRNSGRIGACVEVVNNDGSGVSFANITPGIVQGATYR